MIDDETAALAYAIWLTYEDYRLCFSIAHRNDLTTITLP